MEISEVKSNLNQIILYSDSEIKNVEYLFTACILRKNKKNEFVYSAEIQDLHNKNSILICDLGRLKHYAKDGDQPRVDISITEVM